MDFIIHSLEDLKKAAEKIILNSKYKIFILRGNLGAGKTTLVKYLCKTIGSTDNITSPTFSIVNEYNAPNTKIYHFDLYRINHKEELLNIGFEEYIDSDYYCFIEWPDIALSELSEYHQILLHLNNDYRELTFI